MVQFVGRHAGGIGHRFDGRLARASVSEMKAMARRTES